MEFGDAERTVVLLHGLAGSAGWWNRNVPTLMREYRIVIPDLIGFGRSRRIGHLPQMTEVASLLDHWMGALELGRVHLLGHSMGGQISIHLAAGFPERIDRLVLIDSAGLPRPLRPRALARSAVQLAPPRAWGDPRFLRTILGDAVVAGASTLAQATRHILLDDVRPLLSQIAAPTLVIWGESDRLLPPEHAQEFRDSIPGARLVVLPESAHNPMVDQPEAFNDLVLRFLRGEPVGQ